MGILEDKLEILDLIGRYSHGADGTIASDYADVFTDDGVFQGRTGQPDESQYRGREQILAFVASVHARRGNRQGRHHQSATIFLELTPDRAMTRTYLMTTAVAPGLAPQVGLTSIYEDDIVRTDKGWRIKFRKIYPDVKGGTLQDISRRGS